MEDLALSEIEDTGDSSLLPADFQGLIQILLEAMGRLDRALN